MMENIKYLLSLLKNSTGAIDFFEVLKKYFEDQFSGLHLEVIKLVPFPPFYLPLSDFQDIDMLLKELSDCKEIKQKDNFYIFSNYYVYPINDGKTSHKYMMVYNYEIKNFYDDIKSLCDSIKNIFEIIEKNHQYGFEKSVLQNANLISQMSHDINSMISLIKSNLRDIDESVLDKMNYAEKMTKDVLQYVREIQRLESIVDITELLDSITQNVTIPAGIVFTADFNVKNESIIVDVELIDRAVGEIIINAVSAINDGVGEVKIKASTKEYKNIFGQNKLLKITVENNRNSINPEFITFVKNPFFTTRKSEHHSGLGLSIAEKIIEAHGGNLIVEVTPLNITRVTIYLPIKGNENE